MKQQQKVGVGKMDGVGVEEQAGVGFFSSPQSEHPAVLTPDQAAAAACWEFLSAVKQHQASFTQCYYSGQCVKKTNKQESQKQNRAA